MKNQAHGKKVETLKTQLPFESFDISMVKTKSKKKVKGHNKTASFKSPDTNKIPNSSKEVYGLLNLRKSSLLRSQKIDTDVEAQRVKTSNKARPKSRMTPGIDVPERIIRAAMTHSDLETFTKNVYGTVSEIPEKTSICITKYEFRDMIQSIFEFFKRTNVAKESKCIQAEPINYENYKNLAKRLIINNDSSMPENKLENNLLLLYQKEVLLDEILAILNEEEIDLNNLLSITQERIEANHYEPPNDMSIESGLSLVLEDKIKMPTPKWSNPRIENKLKIDLTTIGVPEGNGQVNNEAAQDKNNQKNFQKVPNLNNFTHNKENIKKNTDEATRSGYENPPNNNHNKVNANKQSNNQGTMNSDMFSKLIPSGEATTNNKASVDSKSKGKFQKDFKQTDEKSTKPGVYADTWSI